MTGTGRVEPKVDLLRRARLPLSLIWADGMPLAAGMHFLSLRQPASTAKARP